MQYFNENIRMSGMGKPNETIKEAIVFLTNVDTMKESRCGNWTWNFSSDNRQYNTYPNRHSPQSYGDTQNKPKHPINSKPGPSKTSTNPPRNLN